RTTASSASVAIVTTSPICGVSATSIPMSGQGTSGAIALSTSDVYFGAKADGNVACGTTAGKQTFTISNTGNQSFSWTAALGLAGASPYSVNPLSGTVPKGGMATVTVTPSAIPAASSTVQDAYSDTLSIMTDITGDMPHTVTLHETAYGAILAFMPAAID